MAGNKRGLYLTADLLFTSRVTSAAAAAALHVTVVGSVEAARDQAREGDVGLLLLDLSLPGCRPELVMQAWRQLPEPPPVVAYAPHVADAQLQAAREAGCTEVLTRGQFDRQMRAVLERYLVTRAD
jgi:CheY-like chemotaxis protein